MDQLYDACRAVCDSIVKVSLKENKVHKSKNLHYGGYDEYECCAELSLCKAELRKDVSRLKEELKKW